MRYLFDWRALALLLLAAWSLAGMSGGSHPRSHLLLEVARSELIEECVRTLENDLRDRLLAAGITGAELTPGGQAVSVYIHDLADIEKARAALADIAAPASAGSPGAEITLGRPVIGSFEYIPTDESIGHALTLDIEARLRAAGIGYSELVAEGWTVHVRLLEPADVERTRLALADLLAPPSPPRPAAAPVEEVTFSEPAAGFFEYTLTEEGIARRLASAASASVGVLYRRIKELGLSNPVVRTQDADRIVVEGGGPHDPDRLIRIVGRRGKLTLQLVDESMWVEDALSGGPPSGSSVLYAAGEPPQPYLVENRVLVAGEHLADAQATFDQYTGDPIVSFRLDGEGARLFSEATQQNVGRRLAIVLDDMVIMAPVIREPILGGTGQFSGDFSIEGAEDIALVLRAGELPAKVNVIEQRSELTP